MSYRTITLYDAERNKTNGNGNYTVNLKADDPKLEDKIKELRLKQRQKNADYKKNSGNIKIDNGKQEINQKKIPVVKTNSPFKRTEFELLLDSGTGNTTFLLGSSKMGKSTALMKIFDEYYGGKEFISILWTANPHIKLYKKHKNLLISGVWNKQSEEIIEAQKKIQTKTRNHYNFCNMFDDVINVKNNSLLDNLLLTYRNSNMSSLISLQYSNLMSKCGRANCNNILCFGFNTDESIEVVIKTFLNGYLRMQGITNIGDQINWYKEMTKDHSFIYIKPADGLVSFHKFSI